MIVPRFASGIDSGRHLAGITSLVALGLACLPNPQSVKEKRENFERAPLRGGLLLTAPPGDMQPVEAVFGDRLKLLGYSLEPAKPKAGDRVKIRFYWGALQTVAEDYQVFVHGDAIGDKSSRIHGDHYPAEGKYPTDVWQPGEVVVDPFTLWIPPGYGARSLGVYTGLYHGEHRVPLTTKGLVEADNENRARAILVVLD